MAHLIGNRYERLEQIGSGGMGTVFRGLDTQTSQPVAIKQLTADLARPDIIERFKREGEALRQLNHPNILKMLDTVEQNTQHYLILEYVSSGSLADLLKIQPRLSISKVLGIALELADALARAHHLKIIHRDVKPANVLLSDGKTPRLTDFGIARFDAGSLTQSGAVLGTYPYLAPEAFSGETLDARADLWALGVMLFEMLAGKRPFEAETPIAIMGVIVTQPPPDLEALRPETPIALIDLIYRLLEKNRDQRIPSARQAGAELEAILRSPEMSARPSRPVLPDYVTFVDSRPVVDHTPHNLPVQATPFVGREDELAELAKLIDSNDVREITILGMGGMGKTRLALEAAAAQRVRFPKGVYFVSLAALTDATKIIFAIAEALKFQFFPGGDSKQELFHYLREKPMLLVLDNFEHLLGGVDIVSELLQSAPTIKIIATSRTKLNLQGETLFRIEGMHLPAWDIPEDVLDHSAVKLFLQGARRVQPNFIIDAGNLEIVAEICRQVQGMPLGILLSAAWVDMLTLEEISTEIAKNLDFLETEEQNVPFRQRSIRAVFEYSWKLLSAEERDVLAKLTVFRGGFTRDSAQVVANASLRTLASLVNKSILYRNPNTGRYELHELLRHYAESKLKTTTDVYENVLDQHLLHYLTLLQSQESRLKSGAESQAVILLEADYPNVEAAWEHALDDERVELLSLSLPAFSFFHFHRQRFVESEAVFKTSVDNIRRIAGGGEAVILLKRLLAIHGAICGMGGHGELAALSLNEAESLEPDDLVSSAFVTLWRGLSVSFTGTPETDLQKLSERLHDVIIILERLNDVWMVGVSKTLLGYIYAKLNQVEIAHRTLMDCINTFDKVGNPSYWIAVATLGIGNLEMIQGHYAQAKQYYSRGTTLIESMNRKTASLATAFTNNAYCCAYLGQYEEGEIFLAKALALAEEVNNLPTLVLALKSGSVLARRQSDFVRADHYEMQALGLFRDIGVIYDIINSLNDLAGINTELNRFAIAQAYAREALHVIAQHHDDIPPEYSVESVLWLSYLESTAGQITTGIERLSAVIFWITSQPPNAIVKEELLGYANRCVAKLQDQLSPEEFAAAGERGKMLALENIIQELLASTVVLSNLPPMGENTH